MTEVRIVCRGGKGLFVTNAFAKGKLILEEKPLLHVFPFSDDAATTWHHEFLGTEKVSKLKGTSKGKELWDAIVPPPSVPSSSGGTFRGMIQAGMSWIQQEASLAETDRATLLDLHHPVQGTMVTWEKSILTLSQEAVRYLKEHLPDSKKEFQDWSTLEKVLLIWACNSFEGGRIYGQISRINHSCNPNAIVQVDGETQRIVAATDIGVDEEVTISYLGLLIYSETSIRQEKLRNTKFFECECQRCRNPEDIAACIPCPVCHPREQPQQSLDEDVQYDDEQTVTYVTLRGPNCVQCHTSPSEDTKLQVVMKNVASKVVTFLDSCEGKNRTRDGNNSAREDAKEEDNEDEEGTVLEEHLGLASSIMGDRHWTTNLLKLLHLDRRLSLMSQAMLTMQELPEVEDIAEAIDSLQRLERFFQSLKLQLDCGHILGDAIIGVARTLVSLGDMKSQQYAAEWLEKISDYIDMFEGEGKQKVVAALKVAWKKHEASTKEDGPVKKKLKS